MANTKNPGSQPLFDDVSKNWVNAPNDKVNSATGTSQERYVFKQGAYGFTVELCAYSHRFKERTQSPLVGQFAAGDEKAEVRAA